MMKCGHPSELAIYSAETGQLLFCDLCDCRSRRNDAEKMEAALTADLAQARQERDSYRKASAMHLEAAQSLTKMATALTAELAQAREALRTARALLDDVQPWINARGDQAGQIVADRIVDYLAASPAPTPTWPCPTCGQPEPVHLEARLSPETGPAKCEACRGNGSLYSEMFGIVPCPRCARPSPRGTP